MGISRFFNFLGRRDSNGGASTKVEEAIATPDIEAEPTPGQPYRDYTDFCRRMEPLVSEYCRNFSHRLPELKRRPLISVILPVYNPEPKWLEAAIESVIDQIYPDWELCIADDCSTDTSIRPLLESYSERYSNIHAVFRERNGHISEASNSALKLASGEYVALLDHDDCIPKHALARIADCINQRPDTDIIYTDEDKIDEYGARSQPHFKSDWNPDLLLGQNYISHFGVYRLSAIKDIGGFRAGYEGAQDWDLVLRLSAQISPDRIRHIPEVLYHWRSISGSTARDIGEKSYAHEAARKALEDYFQHQNVDASLEPVDRFYWRPVYGHSTPSVAIIIPTRDRLDLVKTCIESVLTNTDYSNFRVVVADNDSIEEETLQYLDYAKKEGVDAMQIPGEFNFSRINNLAIASRNEEIVCLLNNDTRVINRSWLNELVMHAARSSVGPVGGKLLFPHDHVQHAGIVLGIGGIGSEAFKFIHKSDDGYIHRAFLVGNYSAVTGACLAVRKSVWNEVGGFDEKNTPNAYSDVDFCLRCSEKGYRSVFTPFAQLVHEQSASRGPDNSPEFKTAISYMQNRWKEAIARDPYYNPNLSLEREDFTLAFPP
ncbi:MAG: glycosyl transferase family 2, partial [Opitutaceae bacterium]|nr:glycosyl transferase family 2 [Opitutaceae bacterium]